MNNEIKEILDNFEKYEVRYKLQNETQFVITHREIQTLLDYITNLQQLEQDHKETNATLMSELAKLEEENDDLKNRLENEVADNNLRLEELAKLEEENERLKETNVYCNRTDCVGRIKDSRKYDSVYQEKEDYKSRCEKAVDKLTIKQARFINEKDYVLDDNDLDEIMYILQNGSDSQ